MKVQFHDIRANVNIFHEEWYKVALELAEKVQLQESMAAIVTDKFIEIINHIVITQNITNTVLPFLLVDHVVAHLQSYFSSSNITVTNGFYLVPYVLCKANNNNNVNLF